MSRITGLTPPRFAAYIPLQPITSREGLYSGLYQPPEGPAQLVIVEVTEAEPNDNRYGEGHMLTFPDNSCPTDDPDENVGVVTEDHTVSTKEKPRYGSVFISGQDLVTFRNRLKRIDSPN